jgi:hypothetical protein
MNKNFMSPDIKDR